jgi:hypothetical protein
LARRPDERAFDHEEFWNYFLATHLVELLKKKEKSALYRFLERRSLPLMTAKWSAVIEPWTQGQAHDLTALLSELCVSELRSGYMKQNAGLIAGGLARIAPKDMKLDSMYFEGDILQASRLECIEFRRCMFNDFVLTDSDWRDCRFQECEVLGIAVRNARLEGCVFDEKSRVVGVLRGGGGDEEFRTYVPETCERILSDCGAKFQKPTLFPPREPIPPVPDHRRQSLERFLRIFERNTGAVQSVIQLKLGQKLSVFEKEVLPALLRHQVIRQTTYRGRGGQNRYELCFPLEVLLQAEDPDSAAPSQLIAFWQELRS